MKQAESGGDTMQYSPFLQLTITRIREFIREPAAVFWVYVFPLLMMIAMGLAFRERPEEPFSVLIKNNNFAQQLLAACNESSQIQARIGTATECREQLRNGETDFILIGLSVYKAATDASGSDNDDPDPDALRTEQKNGQVSRTGISAEGIVYQYSHDAGQPEHFLSRNHIDDTLQRIPGVRITNPARIHETGRSGIRYIDFLVPGLLGLGIMGGGLYGLGYAIVDLRIRKLIKRLVATPMNRNHFLTSIMTSRMIFTIPEALVLLIAARLLFGFVIHGNYLTVGLLIVLGTVEFAGIGLLVASRTSTIETVNGLIGAVMLPMWMASGIFFSYERFPEIVQPVIRILPLTPLIDSLRAAMLEGAGISELLVPISIMLTWTIVTFLLAIRWFRWS